MFWINFSGIWLKYYFMFWQDFIHLKIYTKDPLPFCKKYLEKNKALIGASHRLMRSHNYTINIVY